MTAARFHDPVPDGRSGPFLREPHLKNALGGIGDTFDPRCQYCVEQAEEDEESRRLDRETARAR